MTEREYLHMESARKYFMVVCKRQYLSLVDGRLRVVLPFLITRLQSINRRYTHILLSERYVAT